MELADGQRLGWNPVGNVAKKLVEPGGFRRHIMWASVQEHRPFPACKSCHALLGGHSAACRSRFERIWKDADLIKATAEAVKGARQANSSASTEETIFGNSTNEWDIVKFEWTSSSGRCIISG